MIQSHHLAEMGDSANSVCIVHCLTEPYIPNMRQEPSRDSQVPCSSVNGNTIPSNENTFVRCELLSASMYERAVSIN